MNTIQIENCIVYGRQTQVIMVQNHVDVAFVHEFDDYPKDCCLRPIYPEVSNGSVLVWKKNQVQSPAEAEFIKHINATVADIET